LRGTVRRAVFFAADRRVRVDVFALLVRLPVFFTARFRLAAFFDDTDVGFLGCRVVGFLTDAREGATFFVAADLADRVRLTDDVAFFGPAFLAGARRDAVVLFAAEDFAPEARLAVLTRARVVCPVDTDRVRLRPTTLRTPGPGIRLVCSPVFQRTVIIEPFTEVTTPARGPDLDVTSTRSPTTVIGSSSRKSARV
jgi:hypothetical protein